MQQLTGVDANFLHMETGATFGHVCFLAMLGPAPQGGALTAGAVRGIVEQRLAQLPPLRRRLVEVPFGIDRPYWVEAGDFDLEFHVRELAVPAPGSPLQLAEQVGRIAGRALDRGRPLWELYVISGVDGGRTALLAKFHHAAVDGLAAAEVFQTLLDDAPQSGRHPSSATWQAEPVPSSAQMWLRGVAGVAMQPVRLLDVQRRFLAGLPRSVRSLSRLVPRTGAGSTGTGRSDSLDGQVLNRPPLVPPKTPFNRAVTPHRRWAFGTASLETVKAVKNAFGVTVNDVVMAVSATALRRWLQAHDALPSEPLVAMVPISVRTSEQQGEFGNRVSAMFASLPTHLPDPVDRLQAVHAAMRDAKEQFQAIDAQTLLDATQFTAPALATRAARVAAQMRLADYVSPPYNLVISNVPGPRTKLYLAGAEVLGYYPVSVVADGQGLNITVQSYVNNLDIGLTACRELVPDLWHLLTYMTEGLDELADAAGTR
jgi:WS/DGAT/MGAT family acyltransferase